jgi:hypothetical protein
MAQRYIYLSDELNEKLKLEENVSNLIQRLLLNHYSLTTSPIEKLEEVKRDIEKKNQEAESLRIKVEIMEKKKEEIVKRELEEESLKEDSEERWQRIKKLQREVFNNYDWDKERVEELFNEFFGLLKEGKIKNLIEFAEMKQVKRKEKKQYA